MMKLISLISLCFITIYSSAQFEESIPLSGNPVLMSKSFTDISKINVGTFDSTFIYLLDTLTINVGAPLFDDFSTDKFQKFDASFSDPGPAPDKVYHLLDSFGVVVPNNAEYTEQVTFYREINIGLNTITDTDFTPTELKIGDLSSYPVTHVPTLVYPNFYIYDTLDYPNPVDTVWITADVVQDSATQFFASVNSPESLWADSEAFRNYTKAINPPTLGVATFDGLDENGYPYEIGSAITNYGDHLTSKAINLSSTSVPSISPSDSVYLSFLYQAKGYGDAPEETDSLVVELFDQATDTWNRIWSINGVPLGDFEMTHLPITDPIYFTDGFRFRFRNYGGLSGDLDNFHIDYVQLRLNSNFQDTVIRDFAMVYPVGSLLETYTSVPWDHYKNSPSVRMDSTFKVVVRNNDNVPLGEKDGAIEIMYNGSVEQTLILPESILNNGDLNYKEWTIYTSFYDFSLGPRFDESKTGPKEVFDIRTGVETGDPDGHPENDSCYTEQVFQNYYSYDDGSAEAAYGPTAPQARLAIKYTPYESDSIIGARIHFVPSVTDLSDKLFLLTVWDDNGGEPGEVIYQDDLFFPRQPSYDYNAEMFTDYMFIDTQKVHVGGTFYIGWRQFDPERLNVGLDVNTINNDKTFYSVDGEISWNQSNIEGSVMIHPIFSTSFDEVLGLEDQMYEDDVQINIFPNPSSNILNIQSNVQIEKIELINIQGQNILETNQSQLNIEGIPNGIYFVRVNDIHGPYKIIKQ